MQAIFDEFARLLINDDKVATKIVEDLVLRKVREEIEKPVKKSVSYNRQGISELDHNTLYNMINSDEPRKKSSKDEDESV